MKGDPVEIRPGVWRFRVSMGQDPVTKKYEAKSFTVKARNLTEAKKLRREELARRDAQKVVPTRESFGTIIDMWLETCEARAREETTMINYRQRAKVVKDKLGHVPINVLKREHIQRFYGELVKQGLTPNTVDRYHGVIRGALNFAVGERWLDSNPAVSTARPSIRKANLTIPTVAQVNAILDAGDKESREAGVFLRLAVATWARRGELCALRWNHIDLQAGTLLIEGSITINEGRTTNLKDTKSHAKRLISIDEPTIEMLKDFLKWKEDESAKAGMELASDAFLFTTNLDGSEHWNPDFATRFFRRAAAAAKVEGVRLHDLRHFGPTQALAKQVPITMVSYRLGHAKISTTFDIYTAFIPERDRDVATFMGELMRPQPSIETTEPPQP